MNNIAAAILFVGALAFGPAATEHPGPWAFFAGVMIGLGTLLFIANLFADD